MNKRTHWKLGLMNTLFYLLFIAIIGMLGFLSQKYEYTADWTFGNRNTLTPETQALLNKLEQPLSFTAYVPDDPYLQDDLRKRISKYQRIKPDTTLEFVNPELAPERAKRDGIEYQGQLLVRLGEKQEVIESIDEETLANTLNRLSRQDQRLVVFLEGHEERNPFDHASSGLANLTENLQKKGFRIQPHNLIRSQSIPRNASFLVIASPQQSYPDGQVDILRAYIQQGGNLLWLHEPGDIKGLSALEQELGIIIHEGTLIDANQQLHSLLGIQHPGVIPVIDYQHSQISKHLKLQTLFPFATAIERDNSVENDQWHYEDFLLTLPTSWLETDEIEGNVAYDSETGDKAGPLSIGMTLQRQLNQTGGSDSSKQQRVVVVGDSDFMLNAFIGQGANKDLALAIFDWLANDDHLIDIKPVTAPDTRLDLPDKLLYVFGLFFLIILPLILVFTGLFIWWRRRRR